MAKMAKNAKTNRDQPKTNHSHSRPTTTNHYILLSIYLFYNNLAFWYFEKFGRWLVGWSVGRVFCEFSNVPLKISFSDLGARGIFVMKSENPRKQLCHHGARDTSSGCPDSPLDVLLKCCLVTRQRARRDTILDVGLDTRQQKKSPATLTGDRAQTQNKTLCLKT